MLTREMTIADRVDDNLLMMRHCHCANWSDMILEALKDPARYKKYLQTAQSYLSRATKKRSIERWETRIYWIKWILEQAHHPVEE